MGGDHGRWHARRRDSDGGRQFGRRWLYFSAAKLLVDFVLNCADLFLHPLVLDDHRGNLIVDPRQGHYFIVCTLKEGNEVRHLTPEIRWAYDTSLDWGYPRNSTTRVAQWIDSSRITAASEAGKNNSRTDQLFLISPSR